MKKQKWQPPRIHLSRYDEVHVYCNSRSLFIEKVDNPDFATCKTCKAMYHRTEGVKYYPFGGRPRKDGSRSGYPREQEG
jgi:hypothetical protein